MALTHDKFFLNITLVDSSGVNVSNMKLVLDYADWAALNTAIGAGAIAQIITDLEAVTDALVKSYSVGESFIEDTNSTGAAGSEVENLASITCLIDGAINKYVTLKIPAPVDDIFLGNLGPNRNIIEVLDVALQAWLAHFSAAGECLVSDGEQIADPSVQGNIKGKRIHRGSRKG